MPNHNRQVQPSAKREGFATVPGVTWSDVGALASVREELSLSILEPIAYPEVCTHLGVCMCVCVFIKLHITAQSGPVIRVIIFHVCEYVCVCVCVCVLLICTYVLLICT